MERKKAVVKSNENLALMKYFPIQIRGHLCRNAHPFARIIFFKYNWWKTGNGSSKTSKIVTMMTTPIEAFPYTTTLRDLELRASLAVSIVHQQLLELDDNIYLRKCGPFCI